MAKRPEDQLIRRPAKIRYFEIEASDDTVQKALATFERMHNSAQARPQTPKRVENANSAEQPTLFDEAEVIDGEVAEPEREETNDDSPADRRKRGEGTPKDRNAGIAPVGNVNFIPNDKPSLKSFFAQKATAKDTDQVMVFGYYLQHTLALEKFGPGHVLSAFKHVGKPVPKDLKQTLRNLKNKAWLSFTDIEDIRLTTEGENHVEHVLGKTAGDSGAQ